MSLRLGMRRPQKFLQIGSVDAVHLSSGEGLVRMVVRMRAMSAAEDGAHLLHELVEFLFAQLVTYFIGVEPGMLGYAIRNRLQAQGRAARKPNIKHWVAHFSLLHSKLARPEIVVG